MAKRGYKLQEFVAHAGNVNCLRFGKKNCRVFITGGDDQKVNLWSVGKPTSLMSLCGHTTPVESVAFDSAEILVVAGSSSGAIKLWDLEETKMVRTLTGHRSYCNAVEFHPFGEFFASGSMDTNLKIWDIRKKGCIHTYKSHTRGISTIRFTPDGRWVVSGGFDNVVKVWDLTAGKLLNDFKFHEGHVRSIEFHPLEFLLATGSADKTVKFWDLETFEMIGSARREAAGVRSLTFHPDGKSLFCGFDDSLKAYSWEPVICHDSVDMGWSMLGDLCIQDGKLLGGAYYENSVAVWVADISLIEPYGTKVAPDQHNQSEQKPGDQVKKEESHLKSKPNSRSTTPESDPKEIKTIYVDRVNPIISKAAASLDAPKIVTPSDSKEISTVGIQKRAPASSLPAKNNAPASNRCLVMPNIVPRDASDGKDSVGSRKETIASNKASSVVSAKPHTRRLSNCRFDVERLSVSLDSMPSDNVKSLFGSERETNVRTRLVTDENAKDSSEGKQSSIKTVVEKLDRTSSPATTLSMGVSGGHTLNSSKAANPIKVVNGVAVVHGRTRSLVERFEKKENCDDEICVPNKASGVTTEAVETPSSQNTYLKVVTREEPTVTDVSFIENLMQNHDSLLSSFRSRLTKLQMVRHFWERNDVKGAINAVTKFPDNSLQADVVGVFLERTEVITLDLFSCLLPMLLGLLESKVERHSSVSLEILLKLVAIFGTMIRSTVSAPPAVGVDLHAEERLRCCKKCFAHLQDVQTIIPELVKRGGVIAKCAQQLNLVLQQS
ncbi:LOW QUALITY PROTEIN: katanin p80 WD40 repeat-containing subunit B1 homolog KTN80.1-like [Primulina tabacum]|uniref:LOW QUALITY PROTEIN: katanin p80 WD40 repeat-containing subunit B1 homolog KTN80.1-like n=1 Tax=Primulina tabacum TaxID=48773 RepID=UPI003F5A1757